MSTPKRNRPTIRLSADGRVQVEQARHRKGWTLDDRRWLKIAMELSGAEPPEGWEAFFIHNPDNLSPSCSTLKNRFLKQKNIHHDFFVALCQAVEVRWEEVADQDNLAAGYPPQLVPFFGRHTVLRQLGKWVLDQKNCRLILLYGRAGIGKTAIAYQLVQCMQKLRGNSIAPLWLSLETAMPLSELINQVISHLSEDHVQQGNLSDLISYLRQKPYLIVLDQWETILENSSDSKYRSGYENYQDLLNCISQNHQSCFIIISREKFQYLTLNHLKKIVKSCEVTGLNYDEDREFLRSEGLIGTELELRKFIEIYHNPLILQLIADQVRTVHAGKVAPLVAKDVSIMVNTGIIKIINVEFSRLGELEQSIIYWLAIWRNPISYEQLKFSFGENFRMSMVDESLYLLINQRSLVKINPQSEYYLEPVTLKEITNLLVRNVVKELVDVLYCKTDRPAKLMADHLFIIGDDDDINNEQMRRIVRLIVEQLLKKFSLLTLQQKLENQRIYLSDGYSTNNLKIMFGSVK